jgi:hypothetical protein
MTVVCKLLAAGFGVAAVGIIIIVLASYFPTKAK